MARTLLTATARYPFRTDITNGVFFDGTSHLATSTAPADIKITTKSVRVILRLNQLIGATRGAFGLNTANWYWGTAGSAFRYSYFNAAGVQQVSNSTSGTVVANRPMEVILTHSNDGSPGGDVYLDWYINGAFINRTTNTGGDGGGAWGTTFTLGGAVGTRMPCSIYLAEFYSSALTAQNVYDLWVERSIGVLPLHKYKPTASGATSALSDTGSGTTTNLDLSLAPSFGTNDVPFAARASVAANRSVATGRTFIS